MPTTTHLTIDSLKHKQVFLQMLIFFFVTVVVWMAFALIHTQMVTTLPDDLIKMSAPLNPNIDQTVVTELEQKKYYTPQELGEDFGSSSR